MLEPFPDRACARGLFSSDAVIGYDIRLAAEFPDFHERELDDCGSEAFLSRVACDL